LVGVVSNVASANGGELTQIESTLFYWDQGDWTFCAVEDKFTGGSMVKVELSNEHVFAVDLTLEDRTYYHYETIFKRKVYSSSHNFVLGPYETKSFTFHHLSQNPVIWKFHTSSNFAGGVNVLINYYSSEIPKVVPFEQR
jgi:hypothetical protein